MKWFEDARLVASVLGMLDGGQPYKAVQAALARAGYEVPEPSIRRRVRRLRAAPVLPATGEVTRAARDAARLSESASENKLLKSALAEQASFVDALRAELFVCPQPRFSPPQPEHETRGTPATLLLHASDWHQGQLFSSHNNGRYDLDVAALRMRRMTEKVIAITEAVRAHRTVNKLVIAWGGDIVDGRDIHPGHDWQSAPIEVQLNRGTAMTRDLVLGPLAARFAEVVNIAVPGNHGRIGKKGQLHRVGDNMDIVYYEWLADRCRHLSNLTWHPARDAYVQFTLHGHRFVLAHGDAFKSWLGIPFYGATRYLQRLSSMLHAPIDALLVGHHHNAASWTAGHATISMNGCMVAGGEFATWLGYGGPAVQNLHLVEERFPIATTYQLILTERHEVLTATPLDLDGEKCA